MSVTAAIAIGSLALGAGKAVYGWWQESQASKKLKNLERPSMNVPGSVDRAVSLAEKRGMEGLPTDRMEATARRSTANSVAAIREGARSSSEYIEGVTGSFRDELDQMNRIAMEDVKYKMDASRDIESALMQKGQYEYRAQESRMDDYKQKFASYSGMQQAGVQNMWGGLGDMATAGTNWGTQAFEEKQHKDWMGTMRGTGFSLTGGQAKAAWNGSFNKKSDAELWKNRYNY